MTILAVKDTIEKYGTTPLATAMGLPISTLHQWKTDDRIPGKGPSHDWRVSQFKAAVEKVRRSPKRKSRAA